MNYQFQYPQALWLLAGIPLFILLFLLYQLWRKRTIKKVGDVRLVKGLFPDYAPWKKVIKFCFLMLAFTCGCIALANPRRPDETSAEARKGIDIAIALDVSNSMKATDIAPDRMSRARQFISRLIDQLQDDRLGLVVFAGNAYAQMPLTFDREAARMYTATASPANITAQGTSISDALKKCDLLFGEQDERFRSIILITDGETHDDDALETVNEMKAKGVMINTVGIGSPEGATITDSAGNQKKDASGQVVISRLNEKILQDIARATNGTYVHLQNSDDAASQVMAQFAQIERKALGDTSLMTYQSFYAWLAIPMLLLLVTEIFLPDRKKIKP